MSLFALIIALVLVGLLLYAINAYVPMDPGVKKLLNIVVIVVLVIWLMSALGLLDDLRTIRVPKL